MIGDQHVPIYNDVRNVDDTYINALSMAADDPIPLLKVMFERMMERIDVNGKLIGQESKDE